METVRSNTGTLHWLGNLGRKRLPIHREGGRAEIGAQRRSCTGTGEGGRKSQRSEDPAIRRGRMLSGRRKAESISSGNIKKLNSLNFVTEGDNTQPSKLITQS